MLNSAKDAVLFKNIFTKIFKNIVCTFGNTVPAAK